MPTGDHHPGPGHPIQFERPIACEDRYDADHADDECTGDEDGECYEDEDYDHCDGESWESSIGMSDDDECTGDEDSGDCTGDEVVVNEHGPLDNP